MVIEWSELFSHGLIKLPHEEIDLNANLHRFYGKYDEDYTLYLETHDDVCPPERWSIIPETDWDEPVATIDSDINILKFKPEAATKEKTAIRLILNHI